jgi:hypothetical protein
LQGRSKRGWWHRWQQRHNERRRRGGGGKKKWKQGKGLIFFFRLWLLISSLSVFLLFLFYCFIFILEKNKFGE